MPIREANENDIKAMRKRLQEARERRLADVQMAETVRMVNRHKREVSHQ